jgi:tripartite-type tricarboxylate transporter receptor subunit TctC
MKFRKLFVLAVGLAFSALVHAQPWPHKPVRVLIPFPPGGATDIIGRIISQKLSETWGQPIVIDNRGGAAGNIAGAEVAKAAPDGYTLFFTSGSVVTANEHIYKNMAFLPERDFVGITNCATGPQVLVVPTNSRFKNTKQLIDEAKANPGKLNYGHAGIGSQTHLAAENFLYAAGIDVRNIPYKGEGPAITDIVSGQLDFGVVNLAASISFITGGKLRALGVTSKTRMPQIPDAPTIADAVPGFENAGWFGFVAPKGTPKEIVDKVYQDTAQVLQTTELKARLYAQGMSPVGDSPDAFEKYMTSERARWAKIVAARKIVVQ